ncbi:MAG: cupin domain-containing protein [Chloroflexi bacterium]|nr:cupin domain-containing protein [Chloroflexota bacterium]OJV88430.1 MAG: hypothetical protein BGO39_18285 [Chloroflexi bacterium 54-19]
MLVKHLPADYNNLAPDGSEIRLLLGVQGGGMAHCTLPAGQTSVAVTHRTVEEIWYFLSGRGEVWRKKDDAEQVTEVFAGTCLTIPLGTSFQFRATGEEPLCFIIATLPPWPGPQEAVVVAGKW